MTDLIEEQRQWLAAELADIELELIPGLAAGDPRFRSLHDRVIYQRLRHGISDLE